MKQNLFSLLREFIKVIIIVAIAVPFISLFAAWSEPSQAPTGGNADAPINAGGTMQTKLGQLNVRFFNSFFDTYLAIAGGNVGIGQRDWIANPPTEKLDVEGGIKMGNTDNTSAGTIRWTGIDFEGWTGAAWVSLTTGGTSGPCPPPKRPVLINSQLVCLNDPSYAGVATCNAGLYRQLPYTGEGEVRFQEGDFQTRVHGKSGQRNCDSGWQNGNRSSCTLEGGTFSAQVTTRGVTVKVSVPYYASCSGEKLWP